MNVLILNWKDIKNPHVGGAEVIAFELARRMVADGHTVTFFSREFSGCLKEENIDGIHVVRRGNKLSVYLYAYLYYKSLKNKPDFVVDMINTLCWQTPLYVPKERRVAYLNQLAKEVWLYEQIWPLSIIGYFSEKWQYITYKTTRFLCYSKSTQEDLVQFGIPQQNISIFPLGIDHNRYKNGSKKAKFPFFIFVARLVRMKRADLCIRAIKQLAEEFPSTRLAIIGNGPDEFRLIKLIKKLKLEKNISFINRKNFFLKKQVGDKKLKAMQEAWALLLPSVKEGWGMVVTEAAACGTPSIVTNVTGLRDAVIDKKTGIVVSPNPTVTELSSAMKEIIVDTDKRTLLSKGAIEWSRNFTWERSYEEFKQLLLKGR